MKAITDPKYPRFEIRPVTLRGWGKPVRRWRVCYRHGLAISDVMPLRQARAFMAQHAAKVR